jgi:hypothetical protein
MKNLLILVLFVLATVASYASQATAMVGQTITISVTNDGTPPFGYQWRKDGTAIPGATAATLVVGPAVLASAGTYQVVVSNPSGSTLSDNAVLTVIPTPPLILAPTKATTSFGNASTK